MVIAHELTAVAQAGENILALSIGTNMSEEACGVYARGQVSRYTTVHTSERLAGSAVSTKLSFGDLHLPGRTYVRPRQWATNKAGLASVVQGSDLIGLDDTPPIHPHGMRFCTPGGRHGRDGAYYQRSEETLLVCWNAPGFSDPDSGIWQIEWQVARWTGLVWDTLTATQQLGEAESAAIAAGGEEPSPCLPPRS